MKAFFQTDDMWTGLILRLAPALVMLPHGAQKLLGWYGGFGFSGNGMLDGDDAFALNRGVVGDRWRVLRQSEADLEVISGRSIIARGAFLTQKRKERQRCLLYLVPQGIRDRWS